MITIKGKKLTFSKDSNDEIILSIDFTVKWLSQAAKAAAAAITDGLWSIKFISV